MERYKNLMPILALLALTACAPLEDAVNPYEENFRCRASEETGRCIDTPSAYKEARYQSRDKVIPVEVPVVPPGVSEPDQRYQIVAGLLEEPRKPLLQPPKILRVLLLPYEGEGSELFMARYVYLKVEESDWILSDISEGAE